MQPVQELISDYYNNRRKLESFTAEERDLVLSTDIDMLGLPDCGEFLQKVRYLYKTQTDDSVIELSTVETHLIAEMMVFRPEPRQGDETERESPCRSIKFNITPLYKDANQLLGSLLNAARIHPLRSSCAIEYPDTVALRAWLEQDKIQYIAWTDADIQDRFSGFLCISAYLYSEYNQRNLKAIRSSIVPLDNCLSEYRRIGLSLKREALEGIKSAQVCSYVLPPDYSGSVISGMFIKSMLLFLKERQSSANSS